MPAQSSSITALSDILHLLVHDEDAPCNSPLLRTDEATALRGRRDLGDVDRHLSVISRAG